MSDLIDRQAAINTVKKHYRVDNDLLKVIVYQLENLPSAQPELIEKVAYIRGFEQGRTQGMIDSQGGKK